MTYATRPRKADHTAGLSYVEPMDKAGKVEPSFEMQVVMGVVGSMGYCLLAAPSDHAAVPAFLKKPINARYGLNVSEEDLVEIGKQTLGDELRYNEGAEFSAVHGPDPEFVRTEAPAPTGSVFDVDAEEIASIGERL